MAASTSCSQVEPGKTTTPTRSANGDLRLLDDRVGEEALAQLLHPGPGVALAGRIHREPDGLAHPHAFDAREAQRGQGPLDGGTLRVGDAGTEHHLHDDRE